MNFSELGLSPKVLDAVAAAGYETPTPIQEQAIPLALQGRDVLGIAQTGTGKTGAFALPMLTRLEAGRARARMPRTLIVEPTRELAAQVAEAFAVLGKNHKLTVALLIGGVSFDEQNRKLDRGADVLIATPGRLLDHYERGKLLLTTVEILVIDEADRMLDMGFIPDVERICKLLPPRRQTLFFSATMPPEIQRLVASFLRDPVRIEATPPATTVAGVTQFLVSAESEPKAKRAVLRSLIKAEGVKNAIIFCNRKRDVSVVHRSLLRHGFNAGALHGDLDQHTRTATLEAFRNGEIILLVASDVAARGLDIPDVSHIFNYDVPTHAEDYVHRIGRTARAGRPGTTIMLVTPAEKKYVRAINSLTGLDIPWQGAAPGEAVAAPEGERRGRGAPRRAAAGKKRRRHGRPAAVEEKAPAAAEKPRAKPAEKPKPAKAGRRDAERGEKRGKEPRKRGGRDGSPVVGLGDHVPAFLLRPVRTERD
ncbi:MAG: DEAD/DEAH box helicase [Hyphomicrobiales bacterium]|nr:DEAD/DEAH box helicase [Hyphomicrobiales bacterium]